MTYIPTLTLLIIVELTLFFDKTHLQVCKLSFMIKGVRFPFKQILTKKTFYNWNCSQENGDVSHYQDLRSNFDTSRNCWADTLLLMSNIFRFVNLFIWWRELDLNQNGFEQETFLFLRGGQCIFFSLSLSLSLSLALALSLCLSLLFSLSLTLSLFLSVSLSLFFSFSNSFLSLSLTLIFCYFRLPLDSHWPSCLSCTQCTKEYQSVYPRQRSSCSLTTGSSSAS